ncbi:GTPase IMAP family member 9-like [Danio aesculapii]|uniref:GTPase IMAP family member 9-like n=1 Tax=Danio aesculapii TaxID=1142201 RepID=UPI0024BFA2B2|nr:GTPase IMAP family member 9-like [Danio aesculapii]
MSNQGARSSLSQSQLGGGSSNYRNKPTQTVPSPVHTTNPPVSNELRLVLLGKTGAGKSATGNTILGAKRFNDDLSMSSVTKECQRENTSTEGRNLLLVDTPGFFDTDLTEEELQHEVISCLSLSSPGPHVFLLVIPIERYTEEQQRTVQKILEMFNEDISRYTILIFTHADRLNGGSIQEFISGQKQKIQELVERFGSRFVAFDNNNPENREQVTRLLQKVDELMIQNENRHFSSEVTQMVQQAQRIIDERMQKMKEEVRRMADDRWAAFIASLNKEKQEMDREKKRRQNRIKEIEADIKKEEQKIQQLRVYLWNEQKNMGGFLERERNEEEERDRREEQERRNIEIWIQEEQRRLGGEEGQQKNSGKYRKILVMLSLFLMGVGTGYAPALLAFLFPAAPVAEAGLAAEILANLLGSGAFVNAGFAFKFTGAAMAGAARLAAMTQCTIQ